MRCKDDDVTSHIVTSHYIAVVMTAAAALLLYLFPGFWVIATIPFLCLCLKGLHINTITAILLYVIWGGYLLVLFYPLNYIVGQWCLMGLYSPLILLSKDIRKPPSHAFLILQTVIWDVPLMLWMHVANFFSLRGMEVPAQYSATYFIYIAILFRHSTSLCNHIHATSL